MEDRILTFQPFSRKLDDGRQSQLFGMLELKVQMWIKVGDACYACSLFGDVSRVTKLVVAKLPRWWSTSCCKNEHHCNYKYKECGAYKASPKLLKIVLGPAKDPLVLGLCYEARSMRPVQIKHSVNLIKATGKLFATKISDRILQAFSAGFCCSLNKRAINQMIS